MLKKGLSNALMFFYCKESRKIMLGQGKQDPTVAGCILPASYRVTD